jgi:formate hydrogenlyase transcriptional activator
MVEQTSWANEGPAVNQTAPFEFEDRTSAEVALDDELRASGFPSIVGQSAALRQVLGMVKVVAPTTATVLISGETGTGKELIAEAIHKSSHRSNGPFVKVNCAAIPTGLLESELFGHERGAFTGAIARRIGRFELASCGTIFLDEIGEIPLELQPKLLRVLQEREFERLGDSRTLKSDARLIAATNRNLKAMADEQKFRTDLYYRLNVLRHFVQQFSLRMNRDPLAIPWETMTALVRYPWPGNVPELQNVIERAVIVSNGSVLRLSTEELHQRSDAPPADNRGHGNLRATLAGAERQEIVAALQKAIGKVAGPNGAAALLGMSRSTLQFRMQKLGISASRAVTYR